LHEYCSKAFFVLKNLFFRYSYNAQRNKERRIKEKQKKVYEKKKERKYVCDGFAYEKTLKI
jgi:hypothetical protein